MPWLPVPVPAAGHARPLPGVDVGSQAVLEGAGELGRPAEGKAGQQVEPVAGVP